MTNDTAPRRRDTVLLLIAVCLVAANMRPTITALGPLVDQIGSDTGMSVAALGTLAAVPLVAWALFSPLAHDLTRRYGQSQVLMVSLLVLLGFALDLAPIVVLAAGVAIGALNILHARRRGYCPLPTEPSSQPTGTEAESPPRDPRV